MRRDEKMIERNFRMLLSNKLLRDCHQAAGTTTLAELGFDSLGLSDLAEAIDEKFEVQLPNRTLDENLSISGVVGWIQKKLETREMELEVELTEGAD
jgi:acyl carrier protein